MNFAKLKTDGYFILKEIGTFKQKPLTAFSIVKDLSENSRSINCYVNKAAVTELQKQGFEIKDKLNVVWINRCEFMDFTNEIEPLKITFS